MLRKLLALGVLMGSGSAAWAGQLITPVSWGSVAGTGAYEAGGMFDHQPAWDGTALTGGDESYNGMMAPWDPAGATAYIDFGADYASIRIEQLWTQGMAWRATVGFPSAEVWWDNDVANTTLTTNVAASINFNTKGSLGGATWTWQQDFDYTSGPITPGGRFLKLRVPRGADKGNGGAAEITGTTELAIIGTVVPEPTSIAAIAVAAMILVRRKR